MNGYHEGPEAEMVGAYVLDALPPEDLAVFETHLRTCEECRMEVAELRGAVDLLPLAVELEEPPASLRDRIMDAVEAETDERPALTALPGGGMPRSGRRRGIRPLEGILVVAAVAVIAALGLWNVQLQQRIDRQRSDLAFQQYVTVALQQHGTVYPVAPTSAAAGAAAYMVQPAGHRSAYLIVKDLPRTPSNKVYQLWLLHGSVPRSAATFTYAGRDPHIVSLSMPSTGFTVAAVTEEPGPHGSPGPTGRKVLVAKLGA